MSEIDDGCAAAAESLQCGIYDLTEEVVRLETKLAKVQEEADRRTRELELSCSVQIRLRQRIAELEATLRAAGELPEKWRALELAERTACPDDPHAMDGDDCADELEALLKEGAL